MGDALAPFPRGVKSCYALFSNSQVKFHSFSLSTWPIPACCWGLHIHKRRGICGEKVKGFEIVSNFPNSVVKGLKGSSEGDSEEATLDFCSLPGSAVHRLPLVLFISEQAGVKVSCCCSTEDGDCCGHRCAELMYPWNPHSSGQKEQGSGESFPQGFVTSADFGGAVASAES